MPRGGGGAGVYRGWVGTCLLMIVAVCALYVASDFK